MTGGWKGSNRRSRLPNNWPQLREATKKRAGGRCEHVDPVTGERCPNPGTDCDHKVRGDDHSPENLQLLCPGHHKAKTAAEGNSAKPSRFRPPEPHPGVF